MCFIPLALLLTTLSNITIEHNDVLRSSIDNAVVPL